MFKDTPNKEYIDPWLEKMEQRCQFEKLQDMTKERLDGLEFEIQSDFNMFKACFPDRNSAVQGEFRAVVTNNPTPREPLTTTERQRLRQAEREFTHRVYRARGYRERLRRQHRTELVNSAVDLVNAITKSILGVWATVRDATPW